MTNNNSDDYSLISVFAHSFSTGLGIFRKHGNVETSQIGSLLKMEFNCSEHHKRRHRKIGNGLYTELKLKPETKYRLSLLGRASGNKTKVKLNIYNYQWESVDILEDTCLPVSNEIGQAELVFTTGAVQNSDKCIKYYIIIAFCRCSKCCDYDCNNHNHKKAYLSSFCLAEQIDPVEPIEQIFTGEQVSSLHIIESNNQNSETPIGGLLKFTLPNESLQMKHDPDIQTAQVEHYLAINICHQAENGSTVSEICHMPLYKLDAGI